MTILERPRLIQRIIDGLQASHALIRAPAGYGKSTLLRQIARRLPGSVHVTCTPADVDLGHFAPRIRPHLQPGATLLIDDVHLLAGGAESWAWLDRQMTQPVPRMLLSGRPTPQADMDFLHLDPAPIRFAEADLSFSPDEAAALLARHYPQLPAQQLEAWRQRLAGWPIGLQLLTRLAHRGDPLPAVETRLFDYLLSAVFADLLPAQRQFLEMTAIPLRFNDALAAHLLGRADVALLRQKLTQQGLFLEPAEEPGWFRYHELVRGALLQSRGDLSGIFRVVSRWFAGQQDDLSAIEHLLAGGLHGEAAQAILALPRKAIYDWERYRTFERWVTSLPAAVQERHPELLLWAGHFINFLQGEEERSRRYVERALSLAEAGEARGTADRCRLQLISFDLYERGATPEIAERLAALSRSPHLSASDIIRIHRLLANTLSDLARFQQARSAWQRAIDLALDAESGSELWSSRRGLALYVLLPQGRFQQAQAIFEGALAYFADSPGWQYELLQNRLNLHLGQGDWPKLTQTLAQIDRLVEQIEVNTVSNQIWVAYARARLAIAQGAFGEAESHLAQMAELDDDSPTVQFHLVACRIWLARRRGEDATDLAATLLDQPSDLALFQAQLALEVAIAQILLGTWDDSAGLGPALRRLIGWRCRADLVHLRAALAVACWRRGHPRWRRHVRAARYALKRYPGYQGLLTRKDADLGAHFWPLALIAGEGTDQALAALAQIRQPSPLYPLLGHEEAGVRMAAAEGLAAIGREEALPALGQALAQEKEAGVRQALQVAIDSLERLPPPPLTVRMMGDFSLRRGDQPIADHEWTRPLVQRLFLYFALHRGAILSRERALEDLWPDSDPEKAWATLRNVFGRLRSVLEPYVQSRGLNRYVVFENGVYRVDPWGAMRVDVEEFEAVVDRTLAQARIADVPPLPADFLDALDSYAPLLPAIPFEEWLLESRQRLSDRYIDGALYAARGFLLRGDPAQAEGWARRAIDVAPWLEEAYTALMRALARQGQRSAALRVYDQAVAALRQELDMAPSPQTEWIAQRLRRGEDV